MILDSALNKIIRDITNSILGVPGFAIKSKDKGQRPKGAYADVDVMVESSVGWEEKTLSPNSPTDLISTSQGARVILVSIGFYRDSAFDNARAVKNGFIRESTLQALSLGGLGLVDRSDVRDVSEVLETDWEDRAQFDLTLSAVGNDSELIDCINSAIVSGAFETRGKSIPISVEVNT